MFRKILVPIDGSNEAIKAVKVALEIAEKFGSSITLFHVAQLAYDYSGMGHLPELSNGVIKAMEEEWAKAGKVILETASKELDSADIEVAVELEQGNAAREIVYKAEKGKFDLIVMGSRGLGGISATVMGSVSSQVTRTSACPVLVTR
jgi:nucleotide-binding universal stress UspA family protein